MESVECKATGTLQLAAALQLDGHNIRHLQAHPSFRHAAPPPAARGGNTRRGCAQHCTRVSISAIRCYLIKIDRSLLATPAVVAFDELGSSRHTQLIDGSGTNKCFSPLRG